MHAALTTLAEFFSVLNLFLFHSFLKISLKNCAGRPLSRTQNAVRHGLFRISVHCFPNTFHLIPSRNFQVFTSLQKLRFQPCIIPKLKLLFKSTILDIRLHVYSRENGVSTMGCRVSLFPGICLQHWKYGSRFSWRSPHGVLRHDSTIAHSYQSVQDLLFSLLPSPELVYSVSLTVAMLTEFRVSLLELLA